MAAATRASHHRRHRLQSQASVRLEAVRACAPRDREPRSDPRIRRAAAHAAGAGESQKTWGVGSAELCSGAKQLVDQAPTPHEFPIRRHAYAAAVEIRYPEERVRSNASLNPGCTRKVSAVESNRAL